MSYKKKVKIGNATLYLGDCVKVMSGMKPECFHSVCCDPPYGIDFMSKKWDTFGEKGRTHLPTFQVWSQKWASEALRVLRPGGHLAAFGGSRTYHRMASGVEDAGFEIRDQIMWVYGSGFPKSLNVAKAIDKAARGAPQGGKDPLSPYHGKLKGGTRIAGAGASAWGAAGAIATAGQYSAISQEAKQWDGWGTALKPAHEPIVLARKAIERTVVDNVMRHGTGAINIDATRVALSKGDDPRLGGKGSFKTDKMAKNVYAPSFAGDRIGTSKLGRHPANFVHDGSAEVHALFPLTQSGTGAVKRKTTAGTQGNAYAKESRAGGTPMIEYGDRGSAARFFYTAKVSKKERNLGLPYDKSNNHPTVKPIALCAWLARLLTPKAGRLLDPFMGSGSMGVAAVEQGLHYTGIEQDPAYFEIAVARIQAAHERAMAQSSRPAKKKAKRKNRRPTYERPATEGMFGVA